MLTLKALDIAVAMGRVGGAGAGHVLSHPCEFQVAKAVELVQLNGGLQLHVPGGQHALQGLEPGRRRKDEEAGEKNKDKVIFLSSSPPGTHEEQCQGTEGNL